MLSLKYEYRPEKGVYSLKKTPNSDQYEEKIEGLSLRYERWTCSII